MDTPCGWDSGVSEIASPVLEAAVAALEQDLSAEAAMDAARAAFIQAAAPYPDDDLAGEPAAQLTLVQIEEGALDWTRLGSIAVFTRVSGAVRVDGAEREFCGIKRRRREALRSRVRVGPADLVVVARRWINAYIAPDPIEALMLAHDDAEALVSAALDRHRHDVETAQRARSLIGEPPYWLAAAIL